MLVLKTNLGQTLQDSKFVCKAHALKFNDIFNIFTTCSILQPNSIHYISAFCKKAFLQPLHRRPSEGWSSSRAPRKLPFRQGERGTPWYFWTRPTHGRVWYKCNPSVKSLELLNRFHPLDLNTKPFAAFSSPGTWLNSLLLQYIYKLNFMKWYKEMFTLLAELCQVLWNPKHNGCTDPGTRNSPCIATCIHAVSTGFAWPSFKFKMTFQNWKWIKGSNKTLSARSRENPGLGKAPQAVCEISGVILGSACQNPWNHDFRKVSRVCKHALAGWSRIQITLVL